MSKENSYFLDAESSEEMVRLLEQDGIFTKAMGGFFAERQNDFSGIKNVLDIGCGPGGWVRELANGHSQLKVVGIDISERMIEYADAQAQLQELSNVQFQVMDARKPLDFPAGSFDLVNARYIAGFLATDLWPEVIGECWRLLRPGGYVRLTESEFLGASNSKSMEILAGYLTEAIKRAEHSTSPESRGIGVLPKMAKYLRDTGFVRVQATAHLLEYSSGTPAYKAMCVDWKIAYRLALPFLLRFQVADQQELEELYEQMLKEFESADFCAFVDFETIYGLKPAG